MPRTKPIETYPCTHYSALVRRVADSDEPFTVPCSRAQAASLRGEIHAWRRACEQDKDEARSLGVPVDSLRKVAFRIVGAGLEVIPERMLVGPGLIEAALGMKPLPAAEDPADAAQASLARLLQMGTPPTGD
jgi:hypothetical protein